MDFSFNLFGGEPLHWVPLVKKAEELGFRAVWVSEHLIAPIGHQSRYPHNESGSPGYTDETPLMDPWVAIGHLAAATTRILLGTGVYILPLRHPVLTARLAASAQYFSNGRVLMGVGTGWLAEEFTTIGAGFEDRGKRIEEDVAVIRKLWSGKPVEHHGAYYDFQPVQFRPVPRPIPIIFGGQSRAALVRTGKLGDGFYGLSWPLEQTLEYLTIVNEARKRAGRERQEFQVWARLFGDATPDNVRRYREAGLTKLTVSLFTPTSTASLSEKLGVLERFADKVLVKADR